MTWAVNPQRAAQQLRLVATIAAAATMVAACGEPSTETLETAPQPKQSIDSTAVDEAEYPKPMVPMVSASGRFWAPFDSYYTRWRDQYPDTFGITASPSVPFVTPSEWDDKEGLIIGWTGQLGDVYAAIVENANPVTTIYVMHDGRTAKDDFVRQMRAYGVSTSGIRYIDGNVETVWARDWGPISVKDPSSGKVGIVDPRYYEDRVYDDMGPTDFANAEGTNVFRMPVEFEGGNLISDGRGTCFVSQGVQWFNETTTSKLRQYFRDYLGCEQLFFLEPLDGEGTTHIDMFAKMADATTMILGQYDRREDPTNYAVLERNARTLSNVTLTDGRRLRVVRMPMPTNSDYNFRTYVNSQFINGVNLVPVYSDDDRFEGEAMAIWRRTMPNWRHVAVDSTELITWGGAIHCILMEVADGSWSKFQSAPQRICQSTGCYPNSSGSSCGSVPVSGTCSGGDVRWCEGGQLQANSCTSNSCGWGGGEGRNMCLRGVSSSAPPTPLTPAPTPNAGGDSIAVSARPRRGIPDNDRNGLESTIDVNGNGTVTDVKVSVHITHTYRGDLKVTLSHGGRTATLREPSGGSVDNLTVDVSTDRFRGLSADGAWTLTVIDNAGQDVGTLDAWSLEIGGGNGSGSVATTPNTTGNSTSGQREFRATPNASIPDASDRGVQDTILVSERFSFSKVLVAVDISHTYRSDLTVVLSHGDQQVVLHDKTGGSADDLRTTLEVTGFTGSDGEWTMEVYDSAAQDTGRLNSWSLLFR